MTTANCDGQWLPHLTTATAGHMTNDDMMADNYNAHELCNDGQYSTIAMANTMLQRGEAIFFFFLISWCKENVSIRKKENVSEREKKKNLCRIRHSPNPGFVGWEKCKSTSSLQQHQHQQQ